MRRLGVLLSLQVALFLAGVAPDSVQATLSEDAILDAPTWQGIAVLSYDTRNAALVAAGQPGLLTRVDRLQQQASDRFGRLVASRPPELQEAAWELARYPGLAERMLATDNSPALRGVVADFPQQAQAVAMQLRSDRRLVEAMARFDRATAIAFAALLDSEPEIVRTAFHTLAQQPHTFELLTDDLGATVMLGEAYRNEPVAVAEQLDVLREQALGSAPQMSAGDDRAVPFADVAAAYRARYVYEPPADTRDVHVTTSYGVPYPYWYGYPLWHQRPGWSLAIGWPIPRVIRPYGRMRPPVRILPDRGRSHRHRYRRR